jgi:tyrosyl-tRNA synthetase
MSIPDSLVARYAQLAAGLHPRDVAAVAEQVATGGPAANAAKRRVAREIAALYHDEEAAQAAEDEFNRVHRDHQSPAESADFALPAGDPLHLPAILAGAGLAASTSEARRLIDDGAIRIDGNVVARRQYDVARAELAGRTLQRGRRQAVRCV